MPIPAWVGGVAAGALGMFGQQRSNRINQREAQKNRDFSAGEAATNRSFQERMRNSEWQAAIADMQAAGINPAVAYSQGGASAPGGSMASGSVAAPAGDSVSSAMQAMRMRNEQKLMAAQIQKTSMESKMAGALADREEVRNFAYGMKEGPAGMTIDRSMPGLVEEVHAGIAEKIAIAARAQSMSDITGMGGQIAQSFGQFMPAVQKITGVAAGGFNQAADLISMVERGMRMRDDAVQQAFGMSKAALARLLESLKRGRN